MKNDEKEIFIAIANCSGRSNTGQMSVELAKRLDEALSYARISCLPAIFPGLKPKEKFDEADAIVVIDGCETNCVLKTIEKSGYKAAIHISPDTDYGIEKTPGLSYDEKELDKISKDLIKKVKMLAEKLKNERNEKDA